MWTGGWSGEDIQDGCIYGRNGYLYVSIRIEDRRDLDRGPKGIHKEKNGIVRKIKQNEED